MSGDDTSTFQQILPKKLKIPKFNRPDPNLLDEKIQTYRELVSAKLRNLEPETKRIYRWKNNLEFSTPIALNNLRNLVANNRAVICRSDKVIHLFGVVLQQVIHLLTFFCAGSRTQVFLSC